MKSVLISIKPKWCELIMVGYKIMELRKSIPKLELPFKVYIYCTKEKFKKEDYSRMSRVLRYHLDRWSGKVIGEFTCTSILHNCEMANADIAEIQSLVRREKILEYSDGKPVYGWNISNLIGYDNPKELSEFRTECKGGCDIPYLYEPPCENCGKNKLTRPPQSWCYVEG